MVNKRSGKKSSPKKRSKWNLYVKNNFKRVQNQHKNWLPQKILQELAKNYKGKKSSPKQYRRVKKSPGKRRKYQNNWQK